MRNAHVASWALNRTSTMQTFPLRHHKECMPTATCLRQKKQVTDPACRPPHTYHCLPQPWLAGVKLALQRRTQCAAPYPSVLRNLAVDSLETKLFCVQPSPAPLSRAPFERRGPRPHNSPSAPRLNPHPSYSHGPRAAHSQAALVPTAVHSERGQTGGKRRLVGSDPKPQARTAALRGAQRLAPFTGPCRVDRG